MGDRHHVPAHRRRLGLPGCGLGPVQPQSGRLVDVPNRENCCTTAIEAVRPPAMSIGQRFFWSIKHEWTKHEAFADLQEAQLSVFQYIEMFRNTM
jgi:hypothetical protein